MNGAGKSLSPSPRDITVAILVVKAIRVRRVFKAAERAARAGDGLARLVVQSCLHDEPKIFAAVKAQLQARGRGGRVQWERFLDTMEAV
jgi:hypothetical protein